MEEEKLARCRALLALPSGLHENVPEEIYHARVLGLANKGGVDKMLESAATYYAWAMGLIEDKDTEALRFGRWFHAAVLEPDRFARDYVLEPEWGDLKATEGRTTKEEGKRNKDRRDAWREANEGKQTIPAESFEKIARMRESVLAYRLHGEVTVGDTLEHAQKEITARWRDPETGIEGKCRGDLWLPSAAWLGDLKSTASAVPDEDEFSHIAGKLFYYRGDAWYTDGFTNAGATVGRHFFIVCSKEFPHLTMAHSLTPEAVDLGRRENRDGLRLMAKCIASGVWPGLDQGIHTTGLRPWLLKGR